MMGRRQVLLVILSGAMALSWMAAWDAFIMPILGYRPLSMADEALILALATGVTFLHQGRGWRIAFVIVLQAVGLSLALHRIGHILLGGGEPFGSVQWLILFLERPHTLHEWTGVALSVLWTVVLWIVGVRLAVNPPQRFTVSARFDFGAAAFLTLLLIQLIMIGKGVSVKPSPACEKGFLTFLMFGLLALGAGEQEENNEKGYLLACGGLGSIVGFMMLAVLLGGGLVILFLPSLMSAAEVGHSVLKVAARPMASVLITVLRFIFLGGCRTAQEGYRSATADGPPGEAGMTIAGEPGLLQSIVSWGFIGLAVITGLAIAILAVCWLIRWLLSRTREDEAKQGLWTMLLRSFTLFKLLLTSLTSIIMRKKRRSGPGVHGYARLQRWGARCGLPRSPSETPAEYGSRLIRRFPALKDDIPLLVDLYNRTVFGAVEPDRQQLHEAFRSLKRLASPRHWPARLRTWFLLSSR